MNNDFWRDIKDFSCKLKDEDDILLVSHHDADGITACAIILDLLQYLGKDVEFMVIKQLDSTTIGKIDDRTVVFTDMGSGQLNLIKESGINNFYIIDHHTPLRKHEFQINPHFYGYDGGKDISASGLSYLVAKALDRTNMADIAIVGAVGDMQDSEGKLNSLNRIILDDGVNLGVLKVKNDLRLFGRQSRPLSRMLTYASDPVIPGLTGDQIACTQFIEKLGIKLQMDDAQLNYVDLSIEERQKLTTALYIRLLDCNTPEFLIQRMIGETYTLLKEEKRTELRDAKEFATLLNACGRQEQPEIGVRICQGDRGTYLKKARKLLRINRRMLRDGLNYLSVVGVKELNELYYFDAEEDIDERIVGVVAGMAYGAKIIPSNKPILAFANDKDDKSKVKVSARANWGLIRRGIHLGNAMRTGSEEFGGEGGGHDIAAGARIPKDKKEEFLSFVDSMFREQKLG